MQNLITIVGAIIILAVIILAVYVFLKKHPKKGIDVAADFLDGLQDAIYDTCREIVDTYDFRTKKPFVEVERDILTIIYDKIWEHVENYMKENGTLVTDLIIKMVTKEKVVEYVDQLLVNSGLIDHISESYAACYIEENADEMASEDKELEEKYSDQSQFVEDSDDVELPEAEPTLLTPEEAAKLNPPKDEAEYDVDNDSSVELLPEPKIILQRDKNGNALYFSVDEEGKKKRVTKQFVKESGIIPVEE